jgi:hypothetical protein
MPSTPDRSDTVTHARSGADPGLCWPSGTSEMTAPATEEISPPLPLVSEHQVMLGTAAATAVTPSIEGEIEDEDAALDGADAAAKRPAALTKSGWIARLTRLVTPSHDPRPPRRHYPPRLDREFIADARMEREMHRL